jgi:hypothetical protein
MKSKTTKAAGKASLDTLVGCLRSDWDKGIQGRLEQASSFRSGTLVMSGMGVRACVLDALKAHGITIAPNSAICHNEGVQYTMHPKMARKLADYRRKARRATA